MVHTTDTHTLHRTRARVGCVLMRGLWDVHDCAGEGCEKDIGKAIELYTKASDKGLPVARWNLAWCYHNVVKDLPKAVETYTKAADEGHPGAMWILGRFLETGDIMGRDLKRGTPTPSLIFVVL